MTTIQFKRSTTAGNAPASLLAGEVAINMADKRLWHRNPSGSPIYCDLQGADRNLASDPAFMRQLANGGTIPAVAPFTLAAGPGTWGDWCFNREVLFLNNANQIATINKTDGPLPGTKAIRISFASAPTSGDFQFHKYINGIDAPQLLNARRTSLAFYFRSTQNANNLISWVNQNHDGAGGTDTNFTNTTHTGSANWTRYAASATLANIADAPTDGGFLRIGIKFDPRNSGNNYDFSLLQFQDGEISDFVLPLPIYNSPLLRNVEYVIIPNTASTTFDAQFGRTTFAFLRSNANRTLTAPTNVITPCDGQQVVIAFKNVHATSAYYLTLTTGSTNAFSVGSGNSDIYTEAGTTSYITVVYSANLQRWMLVKEHGNFSSG